jgi:hypothetical protein
VGRGSKCIIAILARLSRLVTRRHDPQCRVQKESLGEHVNCNSTIRIIHLRQRSNYQYLSLLDNLIFDDNWNLTANPLL